MGLNRSFFIVHFPFMHAIQHHHDMCCVLQVDLVCVNKSNARSMKYRVEALMQFLVVSQFVIKWL
jgi:hypothetical protein